MYMNKKKRNLIIAGAVINMIFVTISMIMSIIYFVNRDVIAQYGDYYYIVSYSSNLISSIISFVAGMIGSILLLYSVRKGGKYFRVSQGIYLAGFVIVVICGSFLPWILLFISMFIPDIVIMNTPNEVKREEIKEEREYEEKKKRIEDLKRMRDNGLITEEEYKEKLFELL